MFKLARLKQSVVRRVFAATLLLVGTEHVLAQNDAAATVTRLEGTLMVRQTDGTERLLAVGSQVKQGDVLSTAQDTYARLRFTDTSDLMLRPKTNLKIEMFRFVPQQPEADGMFINIIRGGFRAISGLVGRRDRSKVSFGTPVATIGIRGTQFGIILCQPDPDSGGSDCDDVRRDSGAPIENGLYVDVAEGSVSVSSQAGEVGVSQGEYAYVRDRNSVPLLLPSSEGVRIVVPPSMTSVGPSQTLDVWRSSNQCVIY